MENKEPDITWEHAKIAMAIAVVAPPIAFVFSFFYDWGLLAALGISYSDAPTSITDHIRTGLVWFPVTIVMVALFIVYALLDAPRRSEETTTSTDHSQSSWTDKIIRLARTGIAAAVVLICMISFILWVLFGDLYPINMLYMGLAVFWFGFAGYFLTRAGMRRRLSLMSWMVFVLWPLFPAFFIQLGQVHANKVLRNNQQTHRIHISGKPSSSTLDVNIVRSYGDWLLVHSKPDQIFWIKLDNVDRIDVLDKESFKGLLCLIFKDACPPSENRNEPGES